MNSAGNFESWLYPTCCPLIQTKKHVLTPPKCNVMSFPTQFSEDEKKLIGGYSDYDNFSSRFLELKRIGLAKLISDTMNNVPTVSVHDGVNHVKKSKIINSKIGIKIFI